MSVRRRLSIRTMFYVAILIALVATFGAYRALQATRLGARVAMSPVAVARVDLPEGIVISRADIGVAHWPRPSVPVGAMADADSIAGRVTRVPIFAGDVIVPARLAPEGSGPGLEVKIAPGKRAMAVKINDVAGISGLVQPNSHVDVLVTLRAAGNTAAGVAKLFLEDMRVLSVGTKVQRGDSGKPIEATTATLEVTPAQAEQLAVAMNLGSIQLVLRGYGDPASVHTTGANVADVLAQLRAPGTVVRSDGGEAELQATRAATRRRAPRAAASATASTAPRARGTVPQAPSTASDSVVIRVYRGEQLELHKLAPSDSGGHRRVEP